MQFDLAPHQGDHVDDTQSELAPSEQRHFAFELVGLFARVLATAIAINVVLGGVVLALAGQAHAAVTSSAAITAPGIHAPGITAAKITAPTITATAVSTPAVSAPVITVAEVGVARPAPAEPLFIVLHRPGAVSASGAEPVRR
jgi:hypothetical protein